MIKTAFITGATSGIGKATAELFAKNNIRLILCGRRTERLEKLKQELSKLTEVTTLQFDVSKREEVLSTIKSLPENFKQIDILINNAGNAHGLSTIQDGDVDDWDAMLDINVKGLLYVSKAIIPTMIKNNSGFIVNIGSIENKGLELDLSYRPRSTGSFTWDIAGNISFIRNKILALGNLGIDEETGLPRDYIQVGNTRSQVGRSIGEYFVLKTDGIFQNQQENYSTSSKMSNAILVITRKILKSITNSGVP